MFGLRKRQSDLSSVSTLGMICTFLLISVALAYGQTPRDAWKYKLGDEHVIDNRDWDKYVSDLTPVEQSQVWQFIENSFKFSGISDQKRSLLAMDARDIRLSKGGTKQLLVQANGDSGLCGATGNCAVWLFIRDHGKLRIVLSGEAVWIVVENTGAKGMADITLRTHLSAEESVFTVYRWIGSEYKQIDSYTADSSKILDE